MVQETLGETYKGYKAKTTEFLDWLSSSAVDLGYQYERSRRTSSTTFMDHAITTREVIKQARFLIRKHATGIKVPVCIQNSLYEAIEARKLCKSWYESYASHEEGFKESNSRHSWFIDILEETFRLLLPIFEEPPTPDEKKKSRKSKKAKKGKQPAIEETTSSLQVVRQRFQNIDLEENDLQPSTDVEGLEETLNSALVLSDSKPDEIPKEDIRNKADISFMAWCFFKDQMRTRRYLKSLWKDCSQGKLDRMAASIITDVALELIAKDEIELVQNIMTINPPRLDREEIMKRSYHYIYLEMFFLNSESDGPTPEESEDLINYQTFQSLWYASSHFLVPSTIFPSITKYRERHYRGNISEKSKAEDEFLMKFFHELSAKIHTNKRTVYPKLDQKPPFPFGVEDRIIRCLQDVIETKTVTTAAVFAARILLDVHEILGPKVVESYRDVRQRAAIIKRRLHIEWDGLNVTSQGNPCCENRRASQCDLETVLRAEIKHNLMIHWKSILPDLSAEGMKLLGESFIMPSREPYYFFNNNPVQCGMQGMKILIMSTTEYMHHSNCYSSITTVAHLYNLVRQSGYSDLVWPEMDKIIDANMSNIFHGSLPTTGKTIRSRFLILFKAPAGEIARYSGFPKLKYGAKETLVMPEISKHLLNYIMRKDFQTRGVEEFLHTSDRLWKKAHLNEKGTGSRLDLLKHMKENICDLLKVIDLEYCILGRVCFEVICRLGWELRGQKYKTVEDGTPNCTIIKEWMRKNLTDIAPIFLDLESDSIPKIDRRHRLAVESIKGAIGVTRKDILEDIATPPLEADTNNVFEPGPNI